METNTRKTSLSAEKIAMLRLIDSKVAVYDYEMSSEQMQLIHEMVQEKLLGFSFRMTGKGPSFIYTLAGLGVLKLHDLDNPMQKRKKKATPVSESKKNGRPQSLMRMSLEMLNEGETLIFPASKAQSCRYAVKRLHEEKGWGFSMRKEGEKFHVTRNNSQEQKRSIA